MSEVLKRSDKYLRENISKLFVSNSTGCFYTLVGIHYDLDDFYWHFMQTGSSVENSQYLSMSCDPEQYGFERVWEGQT